MPAASRGPLLETLESRTLLSVVGSPGTPDVVASVPAVFTKSYISGQQSPGLSIPVNLANNGTGTARGVEDIVLFASTDTTVSPDDAQLTPTPVKRAIAIGAGRNTTLKIPIKSLPANLNGSYFVIADVTGKFSSSAVSANQVSITPATVDLSAAITRVPRTARLNGFVPVTLAVTNNGNINAKAKIEIDFAASPNADGSSGTSLGATQRAVLIRPGKTTTMHFSVKIPIGSPSGNQFITANVDSTNVLNDPNLADNFAVSLTPVSIT